MNNLNKVFRIELQKAGYSDIESDNIIKAAKDISKLQKKIITDKNGHRRIVYIKSGLEIETPIGGEIIPEINGLEIEKYSDKSILIKGDNLCQFRHFKRDKKRN